MPKPPVAVEAKARKKFCNSIIPRSSATSKYSNESRSPQVQHERSPQSEACQLNLLAPLKPQEPALRIEAIPANVTVGSSERFCLIHQGSGLRIPGEFTRCEAEQILKVTHDWDWEVDPITREPGCRYRLLWLLESICKPQKPLEVAA